MAADRAHHLLVMNDPEFLKDMEAGLSHEELKKLYGFGPEDTLMSIESYKLFKKGFVPFTGGWMKQDETTGEFTILLKSDIKKHQMEELWHYMQRRRQINNFTEQSKVKAPEDSELLYAIFKARARGSTFPQIFDMYRTGELPSYENKPTNKFATEFDIKKYYSKYYKPL